MPRPLRSVDAALLAALHQTALPNAWDEAAFSSLLSQAPTFGFIKDDVGFILLRAIADEAEILTFAVKPVHQHQGLGSLLLTHGLNEAKNRGATRFFLEVSENNLAARGLYLKAGFTVLSRRENYYPNGDAGVVMEKLSPN